jgi:hypothetical protein
VFSGFDASLLKLNDPLKLEVAAPDAGSAQ